MDQQHQIPLLFSRNCQCVAGRLLYFKALMLKIPRRVISWLAYLVAGFHYETDKSSNSRLSKLHGSQRP